MVFNLLPNKKIDITSVFTNKVILLNIFFNFILMARDIFYDFVIKIINCLKKQIKKNCIRY